MVDININKSFDFLIGGLWLACKYFSHKVSLSLVKGKLEGHRSSDLWHCLLPSLYINIPNHFRKPNLRSAGLLLLLNSSKSNIDGSFNLPHMYVLGGFFRTIMVPLRETCFVFSATHSKLLATWEVCLILDPLPTFHSWKW